MASSLQDKEFLFSQITEFAVFSLDKDGHISSWNKGAEQIIGYQEKEITGCHYRVLYPDDLAATHQPEAELAAATRQGKYEIQHWRKKKDNSYFWAGIVLTAIYDENKKLIGFVQIIRDLSEQKEVEDNLNRRIYELQRINNDLDDFIYTASHDLRSPIINIGSLLDILKSELKHIQNPEIEHLVELLYTSTNRFKKTIKELSEVAKLSKSRLINVDEQENFNMTKVYEEVKASLMGMTTNDCFFQTDFKVTRLRFSKYKFRSILFNLLSNAVKYAAPGRLCQIQIATAQTDDFVVLTVKDNGLGIAEANQADMFKMYRRFHDHVEGTGIGLHTIKRIIEGAGGHITFSSVENEGTEFKIYLRVN